jgi:hypothetical protein
MKTIGFTIFPGWKEIFDKQKEMIIKGEDLGFSEIFFTLDHTRSTLDAIKNAKDLLKIANKLAYYSFINVNPDILLELKASPDNLSIFKEVGFSAIRVHGFTIEKILRMREIGIELNPYEFSSDKIDYLLDRIDPERIKATHDYYPVKGSGLTLSQLIEKSKPFVKAEIPVGAFVSVPSVKSNTTVEKLRDKLPGESAKVLFSTNVISRVLIGDHPTDEEMKDLANVLRLH